jgi:hypothetical protein
MSLPFWQTLKRPFVSKKPPVSLPVPIAEKYRELVEERLAAFPRFIKQQPSAITTEDKEPQK